MTRRDPPDGPQLYAVRVDDAELVRLAAAGDRDAWGTIYDRYADRLHDYCWSILRDRHEAEDALHDAFVTAASKLHQLRDPSSLRPWLYSICRTQALSRTRRRSRELPTDELHEMIAPTDVDEPDVEYLRRLVWDAAGGLAPRDRSVLDLHLRQGLQGQELAAAMGVKEHHATVLLGRVRDHVERSLGALLVARTGRQDCAELDELLSGWDGSLSPLLRKRVARHIDNCDICGERRRRMVSPAALLAGVPILPAPAYLRDLVLDDATLAASRSSDGQYVTTRVQHWAPMVAAAVALLVVAGAAFFAFRPATAPVSATAVAPSPATMQAATMTPESVVVTPSAEPTDSAEATAPAAQAPAIEVLSDSINFGDTETEAALQFRNAGGRELSWTVSSTDDAVAVSPSAGLLGPDESVEVTVLLDRDSLPEGNFGSSLQISGAGAVDVPVSAAVDRAPAISDLSASRSSIVFGSAAGRCATVAVSATVTDDLPVIVQVLWQASSSGASEVSATKSGDTYTATLGPVSTPGSGQISWWVTATDERGNAARSNAQAIAVRAPPC